MKKRGFPSLVLVPFFAAVSAYGQMPMAKAS